MARYKLIGDIYHPKSKPAGGELRVSNIYAQKYRLLDEKNPRTVSLCTTDASVARRNRVEYVEAAIYKLEHPEEVANAKKSFDDDLEDFCKSKTADGVCKKHIKGYRHKLGRTAPMAKVSKLSDIDGDKIKIAIHALVEKGEIGPQTAIHYRAAWRALTSWAVKSKRLPTDPLAELKRGSHKDVTQKKPRRAFSQSEFKKLVSNARKGEPFLGLTGEYRAVLYTVAKETGFRVQELASITPANIDFGKEPSITIDCTISKRRKRDMQEIKPSTAKALRKLSRGLPSHEKMWKGRWWERSTKMLRVDMEGIREVTDEGHLTFHSLRHTMVTRVLNECDDLALAMEICRLSDPDLLNRYYHADGKRRRDVVNRL